MSKVVERLGVTNEVNASGEADLARGHPKVAKGDAEIGVFLTNVLTAPGVAGRPPPATCSRTGVRRRASADTKDAAAAKAIDFLQTPASQRSSGEGHEGGVTNRHLARIIFQRQGTPGNTSTG